ARRASRRRPATRSAASARTASCAGSSPTACIDHNSAGCASGNNRRMAARALAVAATMMALAAPAAAAPLVVVVPDGGDAALAVARLRGQLTDLDVQLSVAPGAVEPALDAQIAAAARLAAERGARAVVWFIARRGGLAVAIATPADRRLFVREIPAA